MALLTLQRALLAALALVCVASDWFLAQQQLLKDWALLRHLVDSGAHGFVGFCAWGVFLCSAAPPQTLSRRFLARCLRAGVTASLLDVDHFIAAGAFSIAGATHLKHRPFGHAVTFIAALALLAYACSSKETRRRRVSFVVVTLLSHQLRDGMRLGLWFWPLGSTPPIAYLLYLALEGALPFAVAAWEKRAGGDLSAEKEDKRGFRAVPQGESDDHAPRDAYHANDDDDESDDKIELRVVSS